MAEFFTVAGVILMVVGGLWIVVEAFRDGILWGLACLFLPFVQIIYVVMHWQETKRPVFVILTGVGLLVLGALKAS